MQACFSLMLASHDELAFDFDAALVRQRDISWISVNSSKPGRSYGTTLLVHSTNRWADEHIDDDHRVVMEHLIDQTRQTIGNPLLAIEHQSLHAWRLANFPAQGKERPFLLDINEKMGVCGDWCLQGRVEAAFTSGHQLSETLVSFLK